MCWPWMIAHTDQLSGETTYWPIKTTIIEKMRDLSYSVRIACTHIILYIYICTHMHLCIHSYQGRIDTPLLIHTQTHPLIPNTQKKAHSQDDNDRNYSLPITTISMSKKCVWPLDIQGEYALFTSSSNNRLGTATYNTMVICSGLGPSCNWCYVEVASSPGSPFIGEPGDEANVEVYVLLNQIVVFLFFFSGVN